MKNFLLVILDGVGIGELPDAEKFGDKGSNTLGNISKFVGGLKLPNLQKMGLANIASIHNYPSIENPIASYGKMNEVSTGKDSTTGHWEIGGLNIDFDFPTYPNGFPKSIMQKFLDENNLKGFLGNKPASGTEIIEEFGAEHLATGFPIVYTSADSVFQIAAHEEIIPCEKLYEICEITRNKICVNEHAVGRIIARPFLGEIGNFKRTTNRKDFSVDPFGNTILDLLTSEGIKTYGIGKINDLFNYRGIQYQLHTKSNSEGIDSIIKTVKSAGSSLIFANLVDFDVYYGHRLDPEGYHKALMEFDSRLPEIIDALNDTDRLVITSDHGNDPTTRSTDHSREYVPLLFYGKELPGRNLGIRETFADVAQTACHFFNVNNTLAGTSFFP